MMKALKIILIVIVVMAAGYLTVCATMPKSYKVERSIVINAPVASVFEEVSDFNYNQRWSPWKEYDPAMQITIDGKPGEAGYKYRWRSANEKIGHGTLTRIKTEPDKAISNKLVFEDFNMEGYVDWTFETLAEGTKATWTNSGELPFVMRAMSGKMEKMMAPDLEKGLQLLKIYCESKPAQIPPINVELTSVQPFYYMAIRDSADVSTISNKLGMMFGEVMASMTKQGLQQSGSPFAIYYTNTPSDMDFEAGIPVDKPGKNDSGVRAGSMKPGNAAVAHFFGNYMNLGEAHEAVKKWMGANGKNATGASWEIYITDPGLEKDTSKWQTDVYYPVN